MKKFIMLIALLALGTSAFAGENQVIARYRFASDHSFDSFTVYNAALLDDGTVVLKSFQGGRNTFPIDMNVEATNTRTFKISDLNFQQLKYEVLALGRAEIKTTRQNVVCMMMPGPGQSNDHLSVRRERSGELELVDGPHGCWLHEHTHPANEYDRTHATIIKRLLKFIAQQ